jgi:hypothetical protein
MNRGPQKLGEHGENTIEDTFYGASVTAVLDA